MNEDYNILSDYPDVLLPEDLMKILKISKTTTYKIPKNFIIDYLINV